MSTNAELLQLLIELLATYDSTLVTAAGSPLRTQVIDPFLTKVGGSPLDMDTETFLVDLLQEQIPEVDTSPTSAMRDLVIRAFTVMGGPYKREIANIKASQSMNNYASMTRADVDALMGNYYTRLDPGGFAKGVVRVYFPTPQSVTVNPYTQFSTGGGLVFTADSTYSINNTQMSFQQDGALYYFDVPAVSESPGALYNIAANSITTASGIGGATRVTNVAKFTGGIDEETKAAGVARIRNSITTRNLITAPGAAFVLPAAFPNVDTLQIIGSGDPEMDRDIISGPLTISGIPGGFLGAGGPDISGGATIHVGGKTDIYVYQPTLDVDDLDIEDVTDKGVRVSRGSSGYTVSGPDTGTLLDTSGHFIGYGVQVGDTLRIGTSSYSISAVSSETEITVSPSTIPGGSFGIAYEIVRKTSGLITVPLYDLAATDASGATVLTASGSPAAAIPGSLTNAVLTDSAGNPVASTHNRAALNIRLPLLRITSVVFLDPITLAVSGQSISMKDLVLSTTPAGFSGGSGSTKASGKARLYFVDPVNCYVSAASTLFTLDGRTYVPVAEVGESQAGSAGVPDIAVNAIVISGDWTSSIAVGDRIELLTGSVVGVPFCSTAITYSSGSNKTTISVRETLADYFSAPEAESQNWVAHVGILKANMTQEVSSGLYFFDVSVEASLVGASADVAPGTVLTASGAVSEGWTLKTTHSVSSYSVHEQPYIQITSWVGDTTEMFVTFTAPAIRLSYEYAASIPDIQTFVSADANRIVAEDVLVRHFVPAYIRASLSIGGITPAAAVTAAVEYVNLLDPTQNFEVSDMLAALEAAGANHVALPLYVVQLLQGRDRSWVGSVSQDRLSSSRIQHFVADTTYITATTAP